jgi:hypothetical protein
LPEIRRDERAKLEYSLLAANDPSFVHTAQSEAGTDQSFVCADQWLVVNHQ